MLIKPLYPSPRRSPDHALADIRLTQGTAYIRDPRSKDGLRQVEEPRLDAADFRGAVLDSAEGITPEHLEQQAKSLEGAIMPNGQKYEDWLKAREKRQQDE
jgi:hypothetical protein